VFFGHEKAFGDAKNKGCCCYFKIGEEVTLRSMTLPLKIGV